MHTHLLYTASLVLLLIGVKSFAQVNLINNGGFEELVSMHVPVGVTLDPEPGGGFEQAAFVFYDSHTIGTAYQLGAPENMYGFQEAYEGEKYGGIVSEAYYRGSQTGVIRNGIITLHSNEILYEGYRYTLKFHVGKMDNSNISPNLEITLNGDQSIFDFSISDTQNWQEKIVQFTAEDNFTEIRFEITNISIFTNDLAGVYLDDVQLYMTCQLEYPCLDIVEFMEPHFPESNIGPNAAFTIENLSNVSTCSLSVISPSSQGQLVFTSTLNCDYGIASPVYWTGTNNSGNPVANGFYTVSVHLENVCGSRLFAGTLVKIADFSGVVTEFDCEDEKPPKPCCIHEPTIFIDDHDWIMETLLFHSIENILVASNNPVTVNTGSYVIMRAGERIELLPGFSTIRPELFVAEIIPCPNLRLSEETLENTEPEDLEIVSKDGVESDVKPVTFYPNPTSGLLTLAYSQQLLTVEVYDPLGRQLLQTAPNATTTSIDLSGQPAGIYIIRAGLEDGSTETHRVVLSPP